MRNAADSSGREPATARLEASAWSSTSGTASACQECFPIQPKRHRLQRARQRLLARKLEIRPAMLGRRLPRPRRWQVFPQPARPPKPMCTRRAPFTKKESRSQRPTRWAWRLSSRPLPMLAWTTTRHRRWQIRLLRRARSSCLVKSRTHTRHLQSLEMLPQIRLRMLVCQQRSSARKPTQLPTTRPRPAASPPRRWPRWPATSRLLPQPGQG
mmetsp:Transcript_111370/g.265704  ORF Transcript_111370/g.265704 Transcript_111370/m.265704 type:complete len:212 (+) Transcript_111370:1345-1980(+)